MRARPLRPRAVLSHDSRAYNQSRVWNSGRRWTVSQQTSKCRGEVHTGSHEPEATESSPFTDVKTRRVVDGEYEVDGAELQDAGGRVLCVLELAAVLRHDSRAYKTAVVPGMPAVAGRQPASESECREEVRTGNYDKAKGQLGGVGNAQATPVKLSGLRRCRRSR